MRHISWFLFILGLALGLIFGLYYAWELSPIDPRDSKPSDLQPNYQVEFQTLIALAYANTGNMSRALRRLEPLYEPNIAQALNALAQKHLADGRLEEDVLAVAQLAAALSKLSASELIPQQTPKISTPTIPPTGTPTPFPTPTQTSTPIPSYQLRSQEKVCDPALGSPLIQVLIFDSAGDPVPGIEVLVLWDQGDDHFFTGLKPELGLGYGDFTMTAGITYTVLIEASSEPVTGLKVEECLDEDGEYLASWLLIFDES